MRRASIFLIAFIFSPAFGFATDTKPVNKFELKPCTTLPGLPQDARCGIYEVWENQAAQSGRKIPLQVVVLPATGPERRPDPIVYFAGGPGDGSIEEGLWFTRNPPELRKDRDILLIDSRGTGRSAPLECGELRGNGSLQGFLEEFIPADKARACRDRLRKTTDLTQYSNDAAVDDVEEIRTALGYGKVNILGTSYGTRTVQAYMRRHPGSVRTALMSGVVPVDEAIPLFTARHAQQALENLITECESDAACNGSFPKLREEVAAVLRRVAQEPVKLQVPSAETGQPIGFTLSKNGFGQVLRRMLYYNNWISITPLYLHQAANGDWQPLAEFALVISQSQGSIGGFFLSVTCSEDLAFVREEEIPAAVAGTFLGDLRVRKQLAACEGWPAPQLGPGFQVPVASDIPTLLLSGGADPVTPPSSGERVARTLKRSRHVVVPDGGHGLSGMKGGECLPQIVSAFIAAGSADALDTSCVARMQRPDFLLSYEPEVRLRPEELARLSGSWSSPDGLKVKTEAVGGYLRAVFPDGPILLAATSPTRFRLRNAEPGFAANFSLQDGQAVSLTLDETERKTVLTRETAAPASKVELKPCTTLPGLPKDALCGTYEVWENRVAKSGRKIPLRVVVLPALGPDRLPDPFIYFEGGPGQSSVMAASWIAQGYGDLRQRRDILLVDFRGTGGSGGLFCPEMREGAGLQDSLDNFYPPARVKACAERLAKAADLSQYTNATSVDDVDEVRAALGYEKLNILGASGGTRAALVYLRRHPETVRTVALLGVVPMDERGPFSMAGSAQRALDGLMAECEGDADCHGAFPRLRDEVAAVLEKAEKEPATVALTDSRTGEPLEVRMTRTGLAQVLRYMLYNPLAASLLPLEVHLATRGDWASLAQRALQFAGRPADALSDGYYLSLTCSEDLPFIRKDEIPGAVQGTFLGDFRIRKQLEACAAWPVPAVGREFLDPVASDVPVLLVSGERDPVTPPANAERAARTLPNSRRVVVPDGGHSYAGIEGADDCVNGLIVQLVETGRVKGLDSSCAARTKRPPFDLKRDPEVELPADQLTRLTGAYKDPESGYELRIGLMGNRLRAEEVGEGSTLVLVATSSIRFRLQGMRGTATFQLSEGRATAVVLEAPGQPSLTLKREGL